MLSSTESSYVQLNSNSLAITNPIKLGELCCNEKTLLKWVSQFSRNCVPVPVVNHRDCLPIPQLKGG